MPHARAAARSGRPARPARCDGGGHLPADVWDGLRTKGRTGLKGRRGQRREPHPDLRGSRSARAGSLGIVPGGTGLAWSITIPAGPITRSTATARIRSSGTGVFTAPPPSFSRGHLEARARAPATDRVAAATRACRATLARSMAVVVRGARAAAARCSRSPGDPSAPTPTPEPATLPLIGSNVLLLGVALWRRFRSVKETQPIG